MNFRHRVFTCLRLFLLIASIALCLSNKTTMPVSATVYKVKLTALKKSGERINWNKRLPQKYRKKYYKLQGSASDGKYIYSNYWNKFNNKCLIMKYNVKTKKRVKSSRPLNIDHGNDMTYNPNTKLLYAVDNYEKPFRVSIINPKTLTVCGAVDIQMPATLEGVDPDYIKDIDSIVGITYDSTRRQYALRVTSYNDFIITDEAFTPLRYVTVSREFHIRRQSIESDQDHVYVSMDKKGSYNLVVAYDWNGVYQYRIRIPQIYELQSICKIGSYYYANFYDNRNNKPKSYVYKFKMPKIPQAQVMNAVLQ